MRRWKWTAAVLGFLAVVVMPLGVGWLVWEHLPPQRDVSTFAAAFGDIVGPLFAAFAFAGLIYTALMQREELSLQREELRETRAELKRTADAQSEQVNIAQMAARLNAATALLNYHQSQTIELARDRAQASKVGLSEAEEKLYGEAIVRFSQARQVSLDEIDGLQRQLRATVDASVSVSAAAHVAASGQVSRSEDV